MISGEYFTRFVGSGFLLTPFFFLPVPTVGEEEASPHPVRR